MAIGISLNDDFSYEPPEYCVTWMEYIADAYPKSIWEERYRVFDTLEDATLLIKNLRKSELRRNYRDIKLWSQP